jgi:hypothetical protein
MSIRITDIDFRSMMNEWPREDIMYLRSICDEKLNAISSGTIKRRTIVRGKG